MLRLALIIFTSLIRLHSAPICPPARSLIAAPKEIASLVTKTAVIGYAERRIAAKFADDHGLTAEQVEKRYAASGEIRCGNHYAQAQVVVRNDTVLTAAHLLFTDDNCKSKVDFKSCRIKVTTASGPKEYRFEKDHRLWLQMSE